ncbi:MAG: hypothetical protein IJH79_11170 [Lentisphaeria bacterium]|nr:hypothetical protein [Lentisphaeria bacterium]
MFTIFSTKDSVLLQSWEEDYLRTMLAAYSVTQNGLWLQLLPWTRFKFKWCHDMTAENGVMGCFTPLHPDTIFLQPWENADIAIKNPSGRSDWIEQIFPTIVHELAHARQWQKSKIAYVICSLPGLRELTLENGANRAQKDSQPFTDGWIRKQDYLFAAAHGMAEKIFEEEENADRRPSN